MASALSVLHKSVVYTVSAVSSGYCMLKFVCGLGKCEDVSMWPTIHHGDLVLLSPFYVNHRLLQKGDVVFCRSPKNPRAVICKRLVALEGETVVNDETGFQEFVDKGQVWLEGDNKQSSIDSRTYGSLPYGLIISKVTLRVYWFYLSSSKLGRPREGSCCMGNTWSLKSAQAWCYGGV